MGTERFLLTHRAPAGLLERAVQRAALPPPGWRPRSVALVAAASLLVGLGGGALLARHIAPETPTEAVAVTLAAPVVQAAGDPQLVHLVCQAPEAGVVAVAGTWNGWSVVSEPMRPVGEGLFAADIHLPAGRYEYMFVVDGARWVPDPAAPLGVDDGFGRRNSVIEI
ncbi:MAG: isoamylase early set domain-containing protein [Pseudomonadota bacterium]